MNNVLSERFVRLLIVNKVLIPYTSNEKGLIKHDTASSNENLAIATKVNSSLLYSHNRKHNSIVRKAAS